ncbi:MAG: hypothetical protein WBA89_14230 [Microcoleus sp.]|uniref:hypothetical protein n=1 Tax=Microcoleus sp. TaxID=44472 RepID=UPI003C73AB3E
MVANTPARQLFLSKITELAEAADRNVRETEKHQTFTVGANGNICNNIQQVDDRPGQNFILQHIKEGLFYFYKINLQILLVAQSAVYLLPICYTKFIK